MIYFTGKATALLIYCALVGEPSQCSNTNTNKTDAAGFVDQLETRLYSNARDYVENFKRAN